MATQDPEKKPTPEHTPFRKFRAPEDFWKAYGNVCDRLGISRSDDLTAHMRRQINRHGTEEDLDLLARSDRELEERHARKGGRPRKNPPPEAAGE